MIQPIGSYSTQMVSRGSDVAYGKSSNRHVDSQIAILNVCGASIAAGGLTAAIARSHTSSWANAAVLGLFGTFLSLFFMTPKIVKNKSDVSSTTIATKDTSAILNENHSKIQNINTCLKPAKKII